MGGVIIHIPPGTPIQTSPFSPNLPTDQFALAPPPSIVVSRSGEVNQASHEFARVSLLPAPYVITARLSLNPRSVPQSFQIGVRLTVDQFAHDSNDGVWLEKESRQIIHLSFIAGANVTQPTFARLVLDPIPPDFVLSYRAVIAATVVQRLVVS